MKINRKTDGNTLTFALEGRLDTTSAPELNKELETLGNIENLVWDLKDLLYISSAGIRSLVLAQKIMAQKGSMKIINANEDIKEVFDITGCNSIFTIE